MFTFIFSKAGNWFPLNMLDIVNTLFDKTHTCVFKFELFEGSDKSTVGHTVACLAEPIWNTEGNWITIESVDSNVANEWVKSKLYWTLELSLWLFGTVNAAIKVGFSLIHKAQHWASYILAKLDPIFLKVSILKLEVETADLGQFIVIVTARSAW